MNKFILFCCFALICNIGIAQEQPQPQESVLSAKKTASGNITVEFKEANIHDVLKIISYKSGINIVAGKDVEGTVTITLVDVPWERALDVILKNNGFVYERDKDIIRVTTVDNLSKEELATELFVLNYANAQTVSLAIGEMLTDRGRIKFDQRTNQLLVTDVPSNLYKIKNVVERLDQKTAQVMIEARVIETVLDADERLGIDWTVQSSLTGASTQTRFPLPMMGAKQLDRPAALTEGTGTVTLGTISFANLQLALEILKSRSNTKTLSNPKIITLNNKEAVIHVGRNYNIPLYERNSSTGQMEITDYKKEQIGIKLTVTPHVNAQGEITVDLHPEVSSFLQFDNYGNVQAPVFSTREATTQVMVKDGETIVIGGLIKEEAVDYVKKIPILGDLPLLKHLFSKTNKTVDTTDLIIFVTVKLLNPQGEELKNVSRNPD
ncbi:MAG: secretin and TonB N-terminal domain-containing protein [Candidatus Omnitrophica bacterium]|nr:secretin and TonB N-terminal domain-containing protein [Candidatus Omnitrophota bacterium]